MRAAGLSENASAPRRWSWSSPSLWHAGRELPRPFWLFAASARLATAGLVTFGLIGYHLATEDLVPTAGVPVVYAAAMAAEAVAALLTGFAYDRWQGRVLVCLPLLVTAVPALVAVVGLTQLVAAVLLVRSLRVRGA